jgi:transposase
MQPTVVTTPRVLGIDDWAWRKAHRYGTILCDLEAGKVVDLLPDREAATVAAWLEDHPGTEIVSRDRASAYAEATRRAAPLLLRFRRTGMLRSIAFAKRASQDSPASNSFQRLTRKSHVFPGVSPRLQAPAGGSCATRRTGAGDWR